ncbi:hypothetical protein [Anaeromyxobacter oryzisoli]|jgi:hypothetical protein|uniref:hypothetical protein n=1 Tax=Anaeromyxobacter oryzisoli TaxID=2925408 RepID=UPI001F5685A0|nr:hypothetical protein [Anaeromyxobacter sp. SG63]
MLKALAVLRTLFLVFIVGYTVRAMPWWTSVARTFDEQYARCSATVGLLMRAAWLAVAWIALETVLGWLMARRRPLEPDVPKARTGEPPFAPPPHR